MLGAGFVGSVHCVGMCGGLIAVASDGANRAGQRLAMQGSYQGGRLASYLVLGLVAGALGHALDLAGQAAGVGKTAAVVAGLAMTVGGLWAMLEAGGAMPSTFHSGQPLAGALSVSEPASCASPSHASSSR